MTPDHYRRDGFRLGIEAAARIVENGYRCESCGQVFLGNSGHSDTDCSQGYSNWDNATDTDKAAAIRAIDVDEVLAGLSPPAPAPAEQEPVAVIGKDYRLLWSDAGSMSEIVAKHRITVGSPLYAHPAPVPAVPDDVAETAKRLRQATFTKGRMRGGIGGQTIEANMRSTFHEVSAWDLDVAADALEAQAAELARLREALTKINVGEGWAAQIARTALAAMKTSHD